MFLADMIEYRDAEKYKHEKSLTPAHSCFSSSRSQTDVRKIFHWENKESNKNHLKYAACDFLWVKAFVHLTHHAAFTKV